MGLLLVLVLVLVLALVLVLVQLLTLDYSAQRISTGLSSRQRCRPNASFVVMDGHGSGALADVAV